MKNLSKGIHWLTEPPAALAEAERRRTRLLAWLQSTLIILVSLGLVLTMLENPPGTPRRGAYLILLIALIVILLLAYALNRVGQYQTSSILTVLTSFLGPWGSILLDPQILHGDFIPLVYVSLSILLCSLLLPAWITSLLAAVQLIAMWVLSLLDPALAAFNWPSLLAFVFFLAVLSILVSLINQYDMRLIDRQTTQLSQSATQLQAIMDNSTAAIYLKDTRGIMQAFACE